ncbi:MAG: glycosyltransferase family 4 protein [Sideroxydans sp.]
MKKTILFVHQSADLYGSDRVLLALVTRLPRERFLPIVALPVDGPLVAELQAAGVECHVLPVARLSRATLSLRGLLGLPADLAQSLRAFQRALHGRQVDLVHSNTLAVLSGAIWARWRRVPHVWHVHEIIIHPRFVRKAYAWLLGWFASRIICVSRATEDNLLQDKPALARKTRVVWNGLAREASVDVDEVRAYRHSVGTQDGDVLIALLGRINRLKGQRILVRAAGILWEQGVRNLRFVIVGSAVPGQEHFLNALQQEIDASPARQCFVLQPFARNVWSILDACDMTVIPSTEPESFGMVALEAMAASRPVIAANHGGLAEIVVQGETGLLVPPGNMVALADGIRQLAADVDLRRQMGESGLARFRNEFTLGRHVESITRVYEEAL